ncbi:DNA cytosine methyltransferase [Sphingomonas jatrophae]|uniref:Cytosine-specific methyltransferase n=1 Tax=Sphingomonas jatrophae TaxID=1166337 RepID=A0A1I6JRG8_9SPHN|nr:DNA cytosine methyltransferase [Sphingomonas jatrophae]SFR81579.1 DNA (cytosine-5)-methyltransferase 1 [Sphingomonas jatrophae]
MSFRIIDLFAGAGGMTLGFTDPRFGGGFESVWSVDNDLAATKTFAANFGGHVSCTDIDAWIRDGGSVPVADVVIGGPPCQGFSLLNKRRDGDARRALWQPFMDVVEQSGARVFVIENVAELRGSPEHELITMRARDLGFETVSGVLQAADYGAPQTRKRTVILGWRSAGASSPVFPPLPTHASPDRRSNLPAWRTVRDAIGDLPAPVGTEPRSIASPFNLHFGRNPTAKSVARYKAVPAGGNRFDLQRVAPEITPQCWIRKKSGGTDLFGRLWWHRPSVTIRTEFFKPEKGRYLHPEQHRPITHREAARLMGFPDDFVFVGSKTEIAKQIGNAVPPALASAIAQVVRDLLNEVQSKVAA